MDLGVYVDYRGELVRESSDWMERDFGRRILTTTFLCLKENKLPNDVVKMIGKMVERDYKMDGVWEYLKYYEEGFKGYTMIVKNVEQYKLAYSFLLNQDDNTYIYDNGTKFGLCVHFAPVGTEHYCWLLPVVKIH